MKRILGTIDTENASGEKITIMFNDATKLYTISSDLKSEEIILNEEEMKKLFIALDSIENYR